MSVGAMMVGLQTKLTADQTAGSLYDAVGGRISQGYEKQEQNLPYITFLPIVGTPERHMGGATSLEALVQFDIWGDIDLGPKAVQDIEVKLYSLLEGFALTVSGFDRGLVTFTSRGAAMVEEDCWRVMDEIRIQGTDF
jgi:hypothetical protein